MSAFLGLPLFFGVVIMEGLELMIQRGLEGLVISAFLGLPLFLGVVRGWVVVEELEGWVGSFTTLYSTIPSWTRRVA